MQVLPDDLILMRGFYDKLDANTLTVFLFSGKKMLS